MKKSTSWLTYKSTGKFCGIHRLYECNTFFCFTAYNFGSFLAIYISLQSFTLSVLLFCYSGFPFLFLLKVVRPSSIFILEMKAKLNGSLLLIKVDSLVMQEIHKETQLGFFILHWFFACVFFNMHFNFSTLCFVLCY